MMRFAYMDVGEGREQDAEASQAQHILRSTLFLIFVDVKEENNTDDI